MAKTMKKSSVEEWLDSIDPASTEFRDGVHLRAIGAALDAIEAAERQLEDAVAEAKKAGESWSAIGVVLGTSRQAAHRKFAQSMLENDRTQIDGQMGDE
jgi:dihydroxyacetone kinase